MYPSDRRLLQGELILFRNKPYVIVRNFKLAMKIRHMYHDYCYGAIYGELFKLIVGHIRNFMANLVPYQEISCIIHLRLN
jgi:hypothetical protein